MALKHYSTNPFFFIFGISLLASACQYVHKPSDWDTSKVEIARDEFGVPHIFGKTDADVPMDWLGLMQRMILKRYR